MMGGVQSRSSGNRWTCRGEGGQRGRLAAEKGCRDAAGSAACSGMQVGHQAMAAMQPSICQGQAPCIHPHLAAGGLAHSTVEQRVHVLIPITFYVLLCREARK